MDDKRKKMLAFWSERAKLFGCDPRSNTNDVWLRELEIRSVDRILKAYPIKAVLDFGCANGYSTARLAKANPNCAFSGWDLNWDMIDVATKLAATEDCRNLTLRRTDILQDSTDQRFDFIYAIRVFQNVESAEKQRQIVDRLCGLLKPQGWFYFIESYAEGYAQLNADRVEMSLPTLPIHPHLTLLTPQFDVHVAKHMDLVERTWPSSSYYLTTRLLYSFIAMKNGEAIDYNHPIHQVAAMIPQIGEYGPQQAGFYQKKADDFCQL